MLTQARKLYENMSEYQKGIIKDITPPKLLRYARKKTSPSTSSTTIDMDTPSGQIRIEVPRGSYLTKRALNPRNETGGLPIHPDYGYEPTFVRDLNTKLSQGLQFYDIGAAYGFFIEVAKMSGVNPEHIHAFQGGKQESRKLQLLTQNHPDVKLNKQFVGSGDSMLRLETYIENNAPPDIIKIDTEGAEFDILRSVGDMNELMADIYIEVHPLLIDASDTVAKMVDFIESGGFTVKWADHRKPDADWISFEREYPKPSKMITNSSGPYMIRCEK
jgi:hypothetical protein